MAGYILLLFSQFSLGSQLQRFTVTLLSRISNKFASITRQGPDYQVHT